MNCCEYFPSNPNSVTQFEGHSIKYNVFYAALGAADPQELTGKQVLSSYLFTSFLWTLEGSESWLSAGMSLHLDITTHLHLPHTYEVGPKKFLKRNFSWTVHGLQCTFKCGRLCPSWLYTPISSDPPNAPCLSLFLSPCLWWEAHRRSMNENKSIFIITLLGDPRMGHRVGMAVPKVLPHTEGGDLPWIFVTPFQQVFIGTCYAPGTVEYDPVFRLPAFQESEKVKR